MNTIYLKTGKAEREGSKLPVELKRVLSLLDGRSGSDDLAKRAAPSLRNMWSEIINQLVKGGYIVSNPGAKFEPKDRSVPKSGAAASANDLAYQELLAAEQVIAALATAVAADKAKSDIEAERVIALLEAAAADKAKSDLEAKVEADTQQKAERAARARAEMQAATIAKGRSDAEAKSNAGVKEKEQKKARDLAELETAIHAAKTRSDIAEKSKSELRSKDGMHASDIHRLRDLEIESAALKKLLVEAYMEIAALKASVGIKP